MWKRLKVSVPRGASLTISYVGGDLKVGNLDGNVEVSFVGGDVVLQNMTGEVSFEGVIGGETKTENVRKITMGVQVEKLARMFQQRFNAKWMKRCVELIVKFARRNKKCVRLILPI